MNIDNPSVIFMAGMGKGIINAASGIALIFSKASVQDIFKNL